MYRFLDLRKVAQAAFTIGVILVAQPTAAQYGKLITAKAGAQTPVYALSVYNTQTCRPGPTPKITSMKASHGTLSSVVFNHTFDKGVCKGVKAKSLAIIYTPDKGFRGQDTAVISFVFPLRQGHPGKQAKSARVRIAVK